ncbi:MAG TPA: corrinoid protein [Anaerolineae bacterium]|nr:corrinoid protein [Anaerolineae bacterium]
MTPDEILQQMYDNTVLGKVPEVTNLTKEGLEMGVDPLDMLYGGPNKELGGRGLLPALQEVGRRFEVGDFFVPEMLMSARAMQGALTLLRPLLAARGEKTVGKVVMGTVKGDVHDIGKNLCNIMMEGAGFEVIDLGVNVAPEKFIKAIQDNNPDVVGFSAFLTTTMPMIKVNIEAIKKAGLRDKVKIMAGGAPVTAHYTELAGADGYAPDASATARMVKKFVGADGDAPGGALADAIAAVENMMSVVEPT